MDDTARLLSDHGLLREVIHDDRWMMQAPDVPAITYDTRTVGGGSLLVCKGRFRPEYLDGLDGGWPPTWPTPIIRPPPAPRD